MSIGGRMGALAAFLALAGSPCLADPSLPHASPSRPEARTWAYYLYSLAQQARFDRDYVEALKYLEEAAQSDDSPDLNVELAEFYVSLHQQEQAESRARRALGQEPSHAQARKVLAQILVNRAPEGEGREARLQEAAKIYRGLVDEGTGDETVYLALANLQIARGDAREAAATLERFRSSRPLSADVNLQLARIYQQSNRTAEAVSVLHETLKAARNNPEVRDALASALEESDRLEEAVELRRILAEQNPQNPYAQYRLGTTLLGLGRYVEAREHLNLALQADPRNSGILLALGQAYEGNRQLTQAETAYREALRRDPTSMQARYFLARTHQARSEDAEALELYHQILVDTAFRETPVDRAFFALASSQVGVIQLLQRKVPAAIASLQKALQASEEPPEDLYVLLGRAYLTGDRPEEALPIARDGLKRHPESSEIAALAAEALLRLGKTEEARKEFRDLLEWGKATEEAYLEVFRACLRAEKPAQAKEWMAQALRKHPESKDLNFQSAALVEQEGRFREAERLFRTFIRQNPEYAEALNYLGYMLADRGIKLEEALGLIQRAVSIDPDNAAYLDSLGWVHYRLGHYDQAETYLRKSAKGSRSDPTILEHLGDVLVRRGKLSEAVDAYRVALENGAEKPEEIRKKVRRIAPRTELP